MADETVASDSQKTRAKRAPKKRTRTGELARWRNEMGDYESKLTEETIERIASAIRVGTSFDGAARFGGISRDTFYRWIAAGRRDDAPPPLKAFAEAVDLAFSSWEVSAMQRIHNDPSWQSDAWALERRKSAEYGRKLVVDSGDVDPRFGVFAAELRKKGFDISVLDDAEPFEAANELEALIRLCEKMSTAFQAAVGGPVEQRELTA